MILSVFVDRRYLFPAAVMLNEANRHFSKSVEFVLGTFEGELREEDELFLETMATRWNRNLRILRISERDLEALGHIDESLHFGLAAFGRLALQSLIAEPHIYSDVDVLTLSGVDSLIFPVRGELLQCSFVKQKPALELAGLGCDDANQEFYAGLIVWPSSDNRPNLELAGGGNLRTKYSQHDQALLNKRIGSSFIPLSPALCQLDNPERSRKDLQPGIVHYFGNWKPWQLTHLARWKCIEADCYWAAWFEAEDRFLGQVPDPLSPLVSSLRENAIMARSWRFSALDKLVSWIGRLPGRRFIVGIISRRLRKSFHIVH